MKNFVKWQASYNTIIIDRAKACACIKEPDFPNTGTGIASALGLTERKRGG
jgi:hypothetical protein